jgi:hypothetical protein
VRSWRSPSNGMRSRCVAPLTPANVATPSVARSFDPESRHYAVVWLGCTRRAALHHPMLAGLMGRWVEEGGAVEAERREVDIGRTGDYDVGEDSAKQCGELERVRGTERDDNVGVGGQPVDDEVAVGRQRVETGRRLGRASEIGRWSATNAESRPKFARSGSNVRVSPVTSRPPQSSAAFTPRPPSIGKP